MTEFYAAPKSEILQCTVAKIHPQHEAGSIYPCNISKVKNRRAEEQPASGPSVFRQNEFSSSPIPLPTSSLYLARDGLGFASSAQTTAGTLEVLSGWVT